VWHAAEGFGDEQRFFGQREIDAAAGHFGGEAEMVALRIVAVEREVETVLPARGSMTGAGVAARRGEHRHDVELEGNRAGFFRIFHGDRHLGAEPAVVDAQGGGSVGFGGQGGAAKAGERRVGQSELGLLGDVVGGSIFETGDHDHPVEIGRRFQADFFGKRLDRNNLRIRWRVPARQGGLGFRCQHLVIRPRRVGLDPTAEDFDFLSRKRLAVFFRRHPVLIIRRELHAGKNRRTRRITGFQRRAGVAAQNEPLTTFHHQPAFCLVLGVAFQAADFQNLPRRLKRRRLRVGHHRGRQAEKDGPVQTHLSHTPRS